MHSVSILLWTVPAAILILLLTIILRRVLMMIARLPHVVILIVAVVFSTGVTAAAVYGFVQGEIMINLGVAILLGGLAVGVTLTTAEFMNPYDG